MASRDDSSAPTYPGMWEWTYTSQVGSSVWKADVNGNAARAAELDVVGADTGTSDPYPPGGTGGGTGGGHNGNMDLLARYGDSTNFGSGCYWNGMPAQCSLVLKGAYMDAATISLERVASDYAPEPRVEPARPRTALLNQYGQVYTTILSSYNARDQIVSLRQYQGLDQSNVYQDTVMTYDGYGRLSSRRLPQQSSPTIYSYSADDLVQSVQDARGAVATYNYNNRHLVTGISYSVPVGSNIPASAAVSFSYDEVGNRTQMTDGLEARPKK